MSAGEFAQALQGNYLSTQSCIKVGKLASREVLSLPCLEHPAGNGLAQDDPRLSEMRLAQVS